jgi:mannosylglycerate hydrolase
MTRRRVSIVPHTHWDREWYQPFQSFRLRLVDLLDDLVPRLEADPSFARFLLDGQVAVIDDYLEVRPEAEESIRRLANSGRVAVGPWYILMDEFLVSGETLVRDLQMGMERAAAFGGAMAVGYLPDMFGHVAQMPQLLRLAGFEHAVVWRGVPGAIDRTAFWWSAPDGSRVRAEYLVCGYGNGASIPDDAKALVRRLEAHEEEISSFLLDGILFMNGTDHQRPQPWLGRVVAEANQIQSDYELVITSLEEYLADAPVEGLPSHSGELRSGARANVLMGVTSNRVDVRQAAAAAEQALERQAEPLAALYLSPERWPESLLDLAWKQVVRNSAHDSVCACSLDEVVLAVLSRYAEARHVAEGITERVLGSVADSMAEAGPVVVNPSWRARGGIVEMIVAGDEVPEGCQHLPSRRPPVGEMTLTVDDTRSILGQIREQQIGAHTFVNAIDVEEDDDGFRVTIRADSSPVRGVVVDELRRDLYTRLGAAPDAAVRLRFDLPPSRRVLARAESVPGFGWSAWVPGRLSHPVAVIEEDSTATMSNGLVSVRVDPGDGTFALNGVDGFDRLVDGGDHGDTYNYSPPADDTIVDGPERVRVEVIESGPVRGRVRVERDFRWPERIEASTRSRVGEVVVAVSTVIELRANESLVRVETSFDNPCRDHRLRALFPLPTPAAASRAECAFAVVERGLETEGGPSEYALPTFPSRRFVHAGGLTVIHEGIHEYELVDVEGGRAATLALTLLRATGMLSQIEMAYRPVPAGPPIPLAGSQMLGPVRARYALHLSREDDPPDLYALADEALVPLSVVRAGGGGQWARRGSALEVAGAEVSSVRRRGRALEVRVFNPSDRPTRVSLDGRSGWLVDLRGLPIRPFEGSFELAGCQIATASVTEA